VVGQTARDLALAFQLAQARRSRLAANRIQELWAQLDRRDLSRSYRAWVGPQMVRVVTAGQLASAEAADSYVDAVVAADGETSDRAGRTRAQAFAGIAADGRSLEDLLYLPIITSKRRIASGMSVDEALMSGLYQALRLGSSEVTQAGRGAVGSSMVGQRTIQGYVRVVNPPACARCIVLAGKEYGWNKGFQRHPHCDCVHLPTTLVARHKYRNGFLNPQAYFSGLSRAEQDRVFTAAGARAIREGADISQVVNARRGMYTTTAYGRTVQATREGTTRRGNFYRLERNRAVAARQTSQAGFRLRTPRLLPEEIYKLAESRDDAIRLLRRFGYLT
jgi:hypothetical protein